jgi:hypothetical protein
MGLFPVSLRERIFSITKNFLDNFVQENENNSFEKVSPTESFGQTNKGNIAEQGHIHFPRKDDKNIFIEFFFRKKIIMNGIDQSNLFFL